MLTSSRLLHRWIGKGTKTKRWKNWSICYKVSTSAVSYWIDRGKGMVWLLTFSCVNCLVNFVTVSLIERKSQIFCTGLLGGGNTGAYSVTLWCGSSWWNCRLFIVPLIAFSCRRNFLWWILFRFKHLFFLFGSALVTLSLIQFTILMLFQPVLDIKPYLPYCDSIQEAIVPDWVKVNLEEYMIDNSLTSKSGT